MKIETILWDTIEVKTTDKKKKQTWSCKNASFLLNNRFLTIKEYYLGVHGESCQRLTFGSVQITSLTPWSIEATGEAIIFYINPKKRTIKRPVKILAKF